jgi:hypothetical protein
MEAWWTVGVVCAWMRCVDERRDGGGVFTVSHFEDVDTCVVDAGGGRPVELHVTAAIRDY